MTEAERKIWDRAFLIACAACRENVNWARKGEYATKVSDGFIRSINRFKRREEKRMQNAQLPGN